MAQMDQASGGDPGVKAGLMKKWADRQRWSATLRWQMVGLSMMSDERFDKAADFIDAAVAAEARGVKPELTENHQGCKPRC